VFRNLEKEKKFSHTDKDERIMALHDLIDGLGKFQASSFSGGSSPGPLESDILNTLLKRLVVENNKDAQTQCVRCLSALIHKLSGASIKEAAELLVALMVSGEEDLRDVYKIGLKTLIKELPETSGNLVTPVLIPILRKGISAGPSGLPSSERPIILETWRKKMEKDGPVLRGIMADISAAARNEAKAKMGGDVREAALDCLQEVLEKFRGDVAEGEKDSLKKILYVSLRTGLDDASSTVANLAVSAQVRKRACSTLAALCVCLTDEDINGVVKHLLASLEACGAARGGASIPLDFALVDAANYTRILVITIGKIASCTGARLGSWLPRIISSLLDRLDSPPSDQEAAFSVNTDEKNELRENVLAALAALYSPNVDKIQVENVEGSTHMDTQKTLGSLRTTVVKASLSWLTFDPNYNYPDEVSGQSMQDGDECEEDEYNNDEGYGGEDEDVYDDDFAWKTRRAAARALSAVVRHAHECTLPDETGSSLLEIADLIHNALTLCFRERTNIVRLEVLNCTRVLVRALGAGASGALVGVGWEGKSTPSSSENYGDALCILLSSPCALVECVGSSGGGSDTSPCQVATAGLMDVEGVSSPHISPGQELLLRWLSKGLVTRLLNLLAKLPGGRQSSPLWSSVIQPEIRSAAFSLTQAILSNSTIPPHLICEAISQSGGLDALTQSLIFTLKDCSGTPLSMEAVCAIDSLLSLHSFKPTSFPQSSLCAIIGALSKAATQDSQYKTQAASMRTASLAIMLLAPSTNSPGLGLKTSIIPASDQAALSAREDSATALWNALSPSFFSQGFDSEVKDAALTAASILVAHCGDTKVISSMADQFITNIFRRLSNDTSRQLVIRLITYAVGSPLSRPAFLCEGEGRTLSTYLKDYAPSFCRSALRSLRLLSLQCLDAMVWCLGGRGTDKDCLAMFFSEACASCSREVDSATPDFVCTRILFHVALGFCTHASPGFLAEAMGPSLIPFVLTLSGKALPEPSPTLQVYLEFVWSFTSATRGAQGLPQSLSSTSLLGALTTGNTGVKDSSDIQLSTTALVFHTVFRAAWESSSERDSGDLKQILSQVVSAACKGEKKTLPEESEALCPPEFQSPPSGKASKATKKSKTPSKNSGGGGGEVLAASSSSVQRPHLDPRLARSIVSQVGSHVDLFALFPWALGSLMSALMSVESSEGASLEQASIATALGGAVAGSLGIGFPYMLEALSKNLKDSSSAETGAGGGGGDGMAVEEEGISSSSILSHSLTPQSLSLCGLLISVNELLGRLSTSAKGDNAKSGTFEQTTSSSLSSLLDILTSPSLLSSSSDRLCNNVAVSLGHLARILPGATVGRLCSLVKQGVVQANNSAALSTTAIRFMETTAQAIRFMVQSSKNFPGLSSALSSADAISSLFALSEDNHKLLQTARAASLDSLRAFVRLHSDALLPLFLPTPLESLWGQDHPPKSMSIPVHGILAVVLHATLKRPDLIREVKLGPFEMSVDESIPVRKAALGVLETLLASPTPFLWNTSSESVLKSLREAALPDPSKKATPPGTDELLFHAHATILAGLKSGKKHIRSLLRGPNGGLELFLHCAVELVIEKFIAASKSFNDEMKTAQTSTASKAPNSEKRDSAREIVKSAFWVLKAFREVFKGSPQWTTSVSLKRMKETLTLNGESDLDVKQMLFEFLSAVS